MKTVGIISEYDPFHNGHKYQTDVLRGMGADAIVSVLGGSFSQRGNTHICDKYRRAEAAVLSGGPDLVLELPYPFSCSGATYFAKAGVHIAASACDSLAFGCEEREPQILIELAHFLSDDRFDKLMSEKRACDCISSTPRLTEEIVRSELSEKHVIALQKPNNILAVEYLRAICDGNYDLEPIFIERKGTDHNSDIVCNNVASASHIRELIASNGYWRDYCPKECFDLLNKAKSNGDLPCDISFASSAVLYKLRSLDPEKVDGFAECGGGLGRRIVKYASEARSMTELYNALNTKRYTNARIRRAVISCLLETTEECVASLPEFTSLLAANEKGLSLLRACKMPVLSTPSDIRRLDATELSELYIDAERFISLCYEKTKQEYDLFTRKPAIIVNK